MIRASRARPKATPTLATTMRPRKSPSQRQPAPEVDRVDERPDRDEEEDGEEIAEREEPSTRLGRYGALGDRQTADERREGERNLEDHGPQPGEGEARRDRGDEEEVVLRRAGREGRGAGPLR